MTELSNGKAIHDLQFNRGEWAEFYVFLKLLGEGRIYAADQHLQRNPNSYLEIVKIIRSEIENQILEYHTSPDLQTVEVMLDGWRLMIVPAQEFLAASNELFEYLLNAKGRSFPAPRKVCDFARMIRVSQPKAPSYKDFLNTYGAKNDIIIKIRDGKTSQTSTVGFSIKSDFAAKPTLFNASKASALMFKLDNCTETYANHINSIDTREKILDRFECMRTIGISLTYDSPRNQIFAENLNLASTDMDEVLAELLLEHFYYQGGTKGIAELVISLAERNPLNVPNPAIYYRHRIKNLVFYSFSGFTAGRRWNGKIQVNGGYIVVKGDGDTLFYSTSDVENFSNYLFESTIIEHPSTTKHDWCHAEEADDCSFFMALNFSIRFA